MGARSVEGGLMPGARLSKEEVRYRQYERCLSCDYYYPSGTCSVVDGNISPDGVCNKWEIKSAEPKYKDREFFSNEFDKAKE